MNFYCPFLAGKITDAEEEYAPDELINYEIGGKVVFFDGKLSVEGAIYKTIWENVQLEVARPGESLSFITNNGTAESDGIEYNVVANPFSFLTLIHAATWIDGEYTTQSATKFPGDPIDFVPPVQYSFSTIFNFNWTLLTRGLFRVDYNYQDEMVQTNRVQGFNFSSEEIRLLNARIGWEMADYDFAVYAKNINDIRASQSASVPAYSARTRPRQIGIEANFRF